MHYLVRPHEPVSEAVVSAVSTFEGRAADSLDALENTVDPAALNAIFAEQKDGSPRFGGRVTFMYSDCRVTIENQEYIQVVSGL